MMALPRSLRYALLVSLAMIVASCLLGCQPKTEIKTVEVEKDKEMGVVIRLTTSDTNPLPPSGHIKKQGDPDHVRWVNETTQTITLKFTVSWPFMEPQADIVIPAGASSPWFSADPNGSAKAYPYHVSPQLKPEPPPGEPDITLEG